MLRRGYSVPERVAMFGACTAAAGAVYPAVLAHTGGHGLPCPLRTLTGVPCPFCGLTTATVAIAHGQWAAAASVSPFAYLIAALVVGTAPVLMLRAVGQRPPPRPWSAATRRRTGQVVACLVAMSWIFQLHRYGFL